MAIDTAEKRRCVAHIARFYIGAGVTPNASPDQEWRQQAGRGYCGILADAMVAVTEAIRTRLRGRFWRSNNNNVRMHS